MAKTFRYQDNLGNILSSSPEPFMKITKETLFEGFEDYLKLNIDDYAVYSETSPDTTPKYTMISKTQVSPNNRSSQTAESSHIFSYKEENEATKKAEEQSLQDTASVSIPVPDVIASKMFEQSKMSTINTVYIGSLSIIGLYVLFRYMKY